MTTIIKATNDTAVSVLSTVSTVAAQVGNTVNTVAKTLDMLDQFIGAAHTKQKANIAVDLDDFYTNLIEEQSLVISKRQAKLVETLKQNPVVETLYKENHARLEAVIKQLTAKPAE